MVGERRLTRRRLVGAAIAGIGALAGGSYVFVRGSDSGGKAAQSGPRDPLATLADNIRSGGPPKDGIPPIDEPQFVDASEARFFSDDDVVFGLVHGGEARAYPQLVLVWHEIANDTFADGPLSVTYCPLTGSTVAFRGNAPDGEPLTFGTSGDLVNSNLLMYDRQTDSRWPQILGQAILGPSRGRRLEEVPLDWTTWRRWRRAHPDTRVLSTKTGHLRTYGRDPYGSYTPLGGYYEGDDLFFPVVHEDERLPYKEVVIGVKAGRGRLAVRKSLLRRHGVVAGTVGGDPVAVLYDGSLGEGRAFLARVGGEALQFEPAGEGRFTAGDSSWDAFGRALDGSRAGARLPRLASYDVMWFAWAAFFPDTGLVA